MRRCSDSPVVGLQQKFGDLHHSPTKTQREDACTKRIVRRIVRYGHSGVLFATETVWYLQQRVILFLSAVGCSFKRLHSQVQQIVFPFMSFLQPLKSQDWHRCCRLSDRPTHLRVYLSQRVNKRAYRYTVKINHYSSLYTTTSPYPHSS